MCIYSGTCRKEGVFRLVKYACKAAHTNQKHYKSTRTVGGAACESMQCFYARDTHTLSVCCWLMLKCVCVALRIALFTSYTHIQTEFQPKVFVAFSNLSTFLFIFFLTCFLCALLPCCFYGLCCQILNNLRPLLCIIAVLCMIYCYLYVCVQPSVDCAIYVSV